MTRDYQQFPDDDNGNVLWQMLEDGDDLSVAHEIEYSIAFQHEEKADQCAIYLLKEEQKISLFEDEESGKNGLPKLQGSFRVSMTAGAAWPMYMTMIWKKMTKTPHSMLKMQTES